MKTRWVHGTFVLLLLAACGRMPEKDKEGLVFVNLQADYTGDAVCFDCHQEQWVGFQEHGMARSFYQMTPEHAVEKFEAPPLWHEQSGFYYRAYTEDGQFFQEEYRLDAQNTKIHRLIRRIDYVVGSGNAARTYLTASNGRLHEMPLTWFSQVGQWDFSPGYKVFNKRFDRLVPDRCMACHNSYPESIEWVEGKYAEIPEGIGCERCHGPGSIHVDARLSGEESDGPDLTIVNPAHLDSELQMDVCQQCHLHTTVSVLRDGRGPFDFRPSERLEDHLALFSAPDTSQGLDVISHAERLMESACFVATAPDMTCTTCHDPHEGFRDKGPDYFNTTCQTCHEEPMASHNEGMTNCISCHMPRVPADGAPHASFTDHWIRIVGVEEPEPAHKSMALDPYFARDREGSRRMEAIATLVHGLQQADTAWVGIGLRLGRSIVNEDSTGELQYLIGHALLETGRPQEAIPFLQGALAGKQDVPERLNALAQAYEGAGQDLDLADDLYTRALNIEPALADIRINYGRYLESQGKLTAALEQYRLTVQEKPWLDDAHYNRGTAELLDDNFEEAEAALQMALELQPDHADALGNLGLLYSASDREDDAGRLFARAVKVAPHNPIALGNLGSWYFNRDNYVEAIRLLGRAVAVEPGYLGAQLTLSLAYARVGNKEGALRAARQVLQLDPQNASAQAIIEGLDS